MADNPVREKATNPSRRKHPARLERTGAALVLVGVLWVAVLQVLFRVHDLLWPFTAVLAACGILLSHALRPDRAHRRVTLALVGGALLWLGLPGMGLVGTVLAPDVVLVGAGLVALLTAGLGALWNLATQ